MDIQNQDYKPELMDEVMESLHRIWHTRRNGTLPAEITQSQFAVLHAIWRMQCHGHEADDSPDAPPGVKANALARRLHQSAPSISQRVNEMEALGWVERKSDPLDRRVTYICFTPAGKEILKRAWEALQTYRQQVAQAMGPEKLETLLHYLHLYEDAMAASTQETEGKEPTGL